MPKFNIYVASGKDGDNLTKVGEESGVNKDDALNSYFDDNPREKRTEFEVVAQSNIHSVTVEEEPPKPPKRLIVARGKKRKRSSGGTAKKASTTEKQSGTKSRAKPNVKTAGKKKKSGGGGGKKSPFAR